MGLLSDATTSSTFFHFVLGPKARSSSLPSDSSGWAISGGGGSCLGWSSKRSADSAGAREDECRCGWRIVSHSCPRILLDFAEVGAQGVTGSENVVGMCSLSGGRQDKLGTGVVRTRVRLIGSRTRRESRRQRLVGIRQSGSGWQRYEGRDSQGDLGKERVRICHPLD